MTKEDKMKEDIKVLINKGFFELESGQVVINKHNGVIQNINITTKTYERKKKLDISP